MGQMFESLLRDKQISLKYLLFIPHMLLKY